MSIEDPIVEYKWFVRGMPNLARKHYNRLVNIDPGQIRIDIGPSGISVLIEGRTIKANGEYGQQRRAHWFQKNPSEWSAAGELSELPGWADRYLTHVLSDIEVRNKP